MREGFESLLENIKLAISFLISNPIQYSIPLFKNTNGFVIDIGFKVPYSN